MKTIEVKVYSFNELSEEAKNVAIENFRSQGVETSFIYDDAYQTVKKANDLFNISEGRNNWLDFNLNNIDDNILELKGLRLRKWLINNFGEQLYKHKFYTSIGDNKIINHPCVKVNKYDISKGARVSSSNFYYSRIQKDNSCVLTGVCYDDDFLQPIYDFIDNYKAKSDYNSYQDFENLLTKCFSSLNQSIENEVDYRNSDEAISEDLEANEYEFLKSGERF
jgi:hypothetical protein